MKQVVQSVRTGQTTVANAPLSASVPDGMLIEVRASAISAGTERYVVDLAKKSLIDKARARPDHVKRVLQKIKQEGLRTTLTQVQAKLDEPMPLGYSAAGVVIDCGAGIRRFKPGDRVAVAAPHAGIVSVGENLCALIPDGVTFEQAAYTGIATIALQGVRLAKVTLGERVLVVGTGLIGLMVIAFLRAQGCRVFATDVNPHWLELATAFGAEGVALGSPVDQVKAFSRGLGVDAVIITAATNSNEPIEFSADMCRPKGRIVLVGVAGLNIPRPPFFEKELEFTVSSSMGPGRNDPRYEGKGIDYPIGYARWTVQRNMEAALDQMASGHLPVERLTTHRFDIDDAPKAYDLLMTKAEPYLGMVLTYPEQTAAPVRRIERRAVPVATGNVGISVLGAGNFGRLVLLPLLAKQPGVSLRGVSTAKGLTAVHVADKYPFAYAASDVQEVLNDKDTHAVFILTRHDLHAELVAQALEAGKHVFVEKPLCLTVTELARIRAAVEANPASMLMVGFNRRFSPSMNIVKTHIAGVTPLSVSYRFASPEIPENSWVQDLEVGGGRIIGEGCHAIDACIAITGSPVTRVSAECVGAVGAVRTPDDRAFITLRHANGSVSSISYQAGGDSSAPKERIEVFGGGRTVYVDDWNAIDLWKAQRHERRKGGSDKGHAAELAAFIGACRNGSEWPIPWEELESSAWAAIAAVESLRIGLPVEPDWPME